jgi:hypothetical protein
LHNLVSRRFLLRFRVNHAGKVARVSPLRQYACTGRS